MRKGKLGFTLIEVSLFLAITAALFVGVTVGVQNSINNQRYNDSVQSFMEFLRGVYAEVLNVQNQTTGGKSNRAIYGKLVTFGETGDSVGGAVGDADTVFVYTVVGNVAMKSESGSGSSALELLRNEANQVDVAEKVTQGGESRWVLSGFPESYVPKWGTKIEVPCVSNGNCPNTLLRGMLLIVRHPDSGVVYTYFSNTTDVADVDGLVPHQINNRVNGGVGKVLDLSGTFSNGDIDFCVRPNADGGNTQRSDVRITANARNASAIELIDREGDDNRCDLK